MTPVKRDIDTVDSSSERSHDSRETKIYVLWLQPYMFFIKKTLYWAKLIVVTYFHSFKINVKTVKQINSKQ